MELSFSSLGAALHREPLQLGQGPNLEPFQGQPRLEPATSGSTRKLQWALAQKA